MAKGVRAFEKGYKFYKLLKDLPCVSAGAIFYWDEEDKIYGSIAAGCLKLCWTKQGNCFGNGKISVCGGTIIFHADARKDTDWFVECNRHDEIKNMTLKEIEEKLGYKVSIVSSK